MNDKIPSAVQASPLTPKSSAKGFVRLDRRALLRAGAGSAPVLLTLASNPVSAANSCVVASSFVSVATFKSRNPSARTVNCASRTCEDWRNTCMGNPQLACAQPTVATTFGSTASTYNAMSLRQVLCNSAISTSGELGVLQHLTAMHLSLVQNYVSSAGNVNTAYLRSVWSNYKSHGGNYVVSGVNWNSQQLISWLRYQLNYSMPV